VRGANDRVLPASYFNRFAAGVAGPLVTSTIAAAGHAVELDQPGELATQINAFFADQQY
jgi:pimeloyl-ACP methyl ester carboxylesterase